MAIGLLPSVGKASARLIPDSEAGVLAPILKVAGVIGAELNSPIMDGVSINDVAIAAIIAVPEVTAEVSEPKS